MGDLTTPICLSNNLYSLLDEEMTPGCDSDVSTESDSPSSVSHSYNSDKSCGDCDTSSEEVYDDWFPVQNEYVLSTPTWADIMDDEELENPEWFKEELTQVRKPKQQLISTKLAKEAGVRIALENSGGQVPTRQHGTNNHKRKPTTPQFAKNKKTPQGSHPKGKKILQLNHMKAEEAMAIELKLRGDGTGISGLASTLMCLESKKLQHNGYVFAEVLIPQNRYQHSKEYLGCKFATIDIPKKWGDKVLFILKV